MGNVTIGGGIAYQSAPYGRVAATDVKTGATRWSFTPPFDMSKFSQEGMWSALSTRALEVDENEVYAAGGCQLFAVDRISGEQLWQAQACDSAQDMGIVGAPRFGKAWAACRDERAGLALGTNNKMH